MTSHHLLYGQDYQDLEGQVDAKQERDIRHGFIRKVYGILIAQLALTTAIGAIFTFNVACRYWILTTGRWLLPFSGAAALVLMCAMVCAPPLTQRHPTNLILLFAFTLFEAIGLGATCGLSAAQHGATLVLQAFLYCTLMTGGLTVFAWQTKYNFTAWNGVMCAALIGLLSIALIGSFLPTSTLFDGVLAGGMSILFGMYIVIDTQRLVGTKQLKVSEDDYISIALSLYLDIINLFIWILQLLGSTDSDN